MKRPAALLLLLALAMGTPLTQKPATVTEMVTTEEVSASTEEPTGTIVDPTTEQSDLVSDEVEGVTDSTIPGISTNEPNISTTTPNTDYQPPRHIPTLLEEKLDLLGCDLPLLPPQSRVWKGNETHELLLPITIPEDCGDYDTSGTSRPLCTPATLSWDGAIEIQSGDVLLVRIDDSHLLRQESHVNQSEPRDLDHERMMHEPPTAVYQVTRTGHDNCDVTEGVLLDITPLKIDARKVVTLYDKDLTEGINLLIVVSQSWDSECVRLKVVVKSDNCGENEDCSGKGLCFSNSSMEGFECQCCPGFVGPHCEEQDACFPNPCTNSGICVDISQGHEGSMYQCLCPYGFTGKICEEETDPCTSMPCQNGAKCIGNATAFLCECPRGYTGVLCQHNLNECESSPCVNGICVSHDDGYKCFCQPGYTGENCELQYNECQSSPCVNGGTCIDQIGGFTCNCGRGFTGHRCHIKVDLCEPNPCPAPRYCKDLGNSYSCFCPNGFSGIDCLQTYRPRGKAKNKITFLFSNFDPQACSTNPCNNGGTCWSSMNSFYCACRPGFTGKTCEEEFYVEKISAKESIIKENGMDLEMPISIHFDHLHSFYIAAGTLLSAVLIVLVIVTVCHCRVNKTYKRFTLRTYPLWGPGRPAEPTVPPANNSEWFSNKDKAPMATPSRSLPSLDTTDMYYTLDFGESQSSPLIQ